MTPVTRTRVRTGALASALLLAIAACGGGGDDGGPPVPSQLQRTAGDGVQAAVASTAPASPTVKVTDDRGNGIRGVVVNFAVTGGGGSITATTDTSDASGLASAGTWTLGTVAGANTVRASSPTIAGVTATFTATAVAGPASKLVFVTQPSNAAVVGEPFQGPVIEIQDNFGNRTNSTATVTIALGGNSGSATLSGNTSVAAVDGRATFGPLTTTTAGTLTMIATSGTLASALSNAIAVASGPPSALVRVSGDIQLGASGAPAFLPPTVRVTDAGGGAIAGITVSFTVQSGGGTVSGANVVTDVNGIARVGQWLLGGNTGADANVLRATVGTLTADFRATAAAPAPHQITLRYINTPTRAQQTAFEQAWLRWRDIVRSELSDVNYAANPDTDPCGPGGGVLPAGLVLNEVVDDLIIYVNLRNIDGPGNVLGSAGPCQARGTLQALGMPMVGVMTFDTSDLGALEGSGQLANVILHEMGHVLGIGSLWEEYGVLNGAGSDTTAFTGAAGRAVWQGLGGPAGTKVPVENCVGRSNCGAGTRDSHWRESTFNNELMTGFLNGGGSTNPLSALTIASLQDIGYTVDATRADAYALPTGASTSGVLGNLVSSGPLRALVEQPLPNELRITDTQGRSLGTVSEWKRRRGLK